MNQCQQILICAITFTLGFLFSVKILINCILSYSFFFLKKISLYSRIYWYEKCIEKMYYKYLCLFLKVYTLILGVTTLKGNREQTNCMNSFFNKKKSNNIDNILNKCLGFKYTTNSFQTRLYIYSLRLHVIQVKVKYICNTCIQVH